MPGLIEDRNGSPPLSIVLNCKPTLSLTSGSFPVDVAIKYEAANNNKDRSAKPFTFMDNILSWAIDNYSFSLFRFEKGHPCPIENDDNIQGPAIFLPVEGEVPIAGNSMFVCLKPGEEHRETVNLYPEMEWEEDFEFEVGKKYGFQFEGGAVDWWSWGSKDVSYPCSAHTNVNVAH